MVRETGQLACIILPILLTACGNQQYTVRPGDVKDVLLVSEKPGLRAEFEIALANPGEPSVASATGRGGGCMVTQDTRYPKHCKVDADCKPVSYVDVDGTTHTPHPSAYGYCMSYHNKNLPKTCWMKPSQAYCNIPVLPGKHSIGPVSAEQAYAYLGKDSKLSWRVGACVNGIDADGEAPPPCGEEDVVVKPGERLELAGKESPRVTKVPPLPPPLNP